MRLSEYGILENRDRLKKGDEVRNATPYSHITQLADADLDHERMAWKPVESHWIGRCFGSYRNGLCGKIEGRRFLATTAGQTSTKKKGRDN